MKASPLYNYCSLPRDIIHGLSPPNGTTLIDKPGFALWCHSQTGTDYFDGLLTYAGGPDLGQ